MASVPNGSFTRTNSFGSDEENTFARFYTEPVKNEAASMAAGREIWEDQELVEIFLPGNPWTRPVFKVTDEHRQRWPKLYQQFKAGQEQSPDGKPLEEWPEVSRAQVRELKALGFMTVEQVRLMGDHVIQQVGMGARVLKQKAEAYCAEMEGLAPMGKLVSENELLKDRCDALENQNRELGQMMEQMRAELNQIRDRPHPIATTIPGMADPLQAPGYANGGAAPAVAPKSALDAIAAKPQRRRSIAKPETQPAG